MKVGIIGYGKMGKIRYSAIAKHASVFISDPFLPNSIGPDELIERSDAVFICTPNYLNAKFTIMALERNKHVFCEKPPARTCSELAKVEMVHETKKGLTLMYGFNHRKYDSVERIRTIVDSGSFGQILWMRGRYGKFIDSESLSDWRMDKRKSGGGILIDQGIHLLDLMIMLSGGFSHIQAAVTNNFWKIDGIEDNVFLNLIGNGVTASLHSTMIEWRHIFALEVLLESGYLALNGLKTPSGAYGKETLTICEDKHRSSKMKTSTVIEYEHNNSWDKEAAAFMSSIGSGYTNIQQAKMVMELIEKAYRDTGFYKDHDEEIS